MAFTRLSSVTSFSRSLSILVLATTRHGWLTINHRENREVLRSPVHLSLLLALVVAGIALLVTGLRSGEPLMLVFGALESVLAVNMLRYTFKPLLQPREWWLEHLGGLIGSGIGTYTAFFVFGGSSLFEPLFRDSFQGMSILLWVAPGVIGGVAITWLSRHYRRRFAGSAADSLVVAGADQHRIAFAVPEQGKALFRVPGGRARALGERDAPGL